MIDNQSVVSKSLSSHRTNGSSGPGASSSFGADDDAPRNRTAYSAPVVAKREEANVFKAKLLVALILLLAVVSVATSTFLLVKHQEQANFESHVSAQLSLLSFLPSGESHEFAPFSFPRYTSIRAMLPKS